MFLCPLYEVESLGKWELFFAGPRFYTRTSTVWFHGTCFFTLVLVHTCSRNQLIITGRYQKMRNAHLYFEKKKKRNYYKGSPFIYLRFPRYTDYISASRTVELLPLCRSFGWVVWMRGFLAVGLLLSLWFFTLSGDSLGRCFLPRQKRDASPCVLATLTRKRGSVPKNSLSLMKVCQHFPVACSDSMVSAYDGSFSSALIRSRHSHLRSPWAAS